MLCVGLNEFDQVVSDGASCQYVLVESDDFLASQSLESEAIAESFGFGFAAVITIWALAYAAQAAITVLKKL